MNDEIVYPIGCKPIDDDLGPDELVRRLKVLAHTFQNLDQDEEVNQQFIPLALHLVDEQFLTHSSKEVQLLIACCIADVLRVYAPEAPYKDQEQIKEIFYFFVQQLNGLKDPKDPTFKRYFYLLENLAYVKSFNMCFELEECQDIFCKLFTTVFKIVNDDHSSKVKSFILDVLCPLITESDSVSNELLDIILSNLVEPQKSSRKNAYYIAKEVLIKTADTLKTYAQALCNQILLSEKMDKSYAIAPKIYELIYELNVLHPSILLTILPQLEFKLKSSREADRVKVVVLLARMFSEKDSVLSRQHTSLWRIFLGRFYDISSSIRIKCVQSSMHFLLNHPHLRREITDALRERNHDSDETVRYEVVMAIVETAKRDFKIIGESEDLLTFVKERTLDKKFKVRKEAMNGLAFIYKKHLSDATDLCDATKRATNWIKDKILHGYYMKGIEDRLLVERLLITCLVPYQLPAEERMKKLYKLLGTIDDNATKAFMELQRNQLKVRKLVAEWIKMHRMKGNDAKLAADLSAKCSVISKQLPDPLKALEYLMKFSQHMRTEPRLILEMETILRKDVSCRECADTMTIVLKRLGQPIMTNLYYNTIKMLLERIASVMVDEGAIACLVGLVEECMDGGGASADLCEEIDLSAEVAGERGLKLLSVLANVFSAHFLHQDTLSHMVSLLSHDQDYVAPYILKALTQLGRYRPLVHSFPGVMKNLEPVCKELAMSGTPKQAKHAILCLYVNSNAQTVTGSNGGGANSSAETSGGGGGENGATTPGEGDLFGEIVDSLKVTLNADHEKYRTAIVTLGHIAQHMPERFLVPIKNLISRKIVKELLVRDVEEERENVPTGEWCAEEELPEETKCKVEGLKTMARWLLGLKKDVPSAQKTFRMLYAFMKQKGDLLDQKRISPAEMSWLRLSAGKAMLKICEQQGVGDQFTVDQFYMLSQLMLDPVTEVREHFVKKLHKGLYKGIREKCLPIDFMGIYALGGREKNPKLLAMIKSYVELDVARRREFVKTPATLAGGQLDSAAHILPDYMLGFAVPVLAHDPNFTKYNVRAQLLQIEKCLWLILEPLIVSKEFFCFGFYKNLVDRMKNHKDALNPDDEETNMKLWAICDIAMHLVYTKSASYDTRDLATEARIPSMYFVAQPDSFQNTRIYIPGDYFTTSKKVLTDRKQQQQAAAAALAKKVMDELNESNNDSNNSDGGESEENEEPPVKKMLMAKD